MDAYEKEFMSGEEGANKHAVKKLTRTIEVELLKMTVNAPDWYVVSSKPQEFKLMFRDTAFAAEMARELLWEKDDDLKLEDFVDVSQT
jgi:glycerol-3-phosphate O-acyltransferase/dihydroxyacetone phosphate acyltransferase